jgi:hypothetical protein
MSVIYSQTAINGRLNAVVSAIDQGLTNGYLYLYANNSVVSTIQLAYPAGTVNGGILTFGGTLLDPSAAGTGLVTAGVITDSNGNVMISGMTVGIPLSGAQILINNGLNTTAISSGQAVSVTGQITGS